MIVPSHSLPRIPRGISDSGPEMRGDLQAKMYDGDGRGAR